MRLRDRVAIVTGSGSGLGAAIVRRLAAEGASVVVTDVNQQGIDAVVRELTDAGLTAIGFNANVAKQSDLKEVIKKTVEKFGRIDILVNNAGVQRVKPYLTITDEDWDYVIGVDLKGVFFCIQAVAEQMIRQQYGKIVNISSSVATGTGAVWPGGYAAASIAIYSAAKAGVIQLTKTFARELGPHGINVNCVAPGNVGKPMPGRNTQTPEEIEVHTAFKRSLTVMNRAGEPEDIANSVLFLASEEASFISGHVLPADGGRTDRL